MNEIKILDKIKRISHKELQIMEVCGTHTHEIARYGLKEVLPSHIVLHSGPGCPVCVTSENTIDQAIELAEQNVWICTYGDMFRVRGSRQSLYDISLMGKVIKILYSPQDIIDIALKNPQQEIVFLGVGFETTAPIMAVLVQMVMEMKIKNVSFLFSLKRMDPILRYLLSQNKTLDGLILPGHVAAITGANYFNFMKEYQVSSVICGFETIDILHGVYQIISKPYQFKNLYTRVVTDTGNKKAQLIIEEVFDIRDEVWRGIGIIHNSGFTLKEKYQSLNAITRFNITKESPRKKTKCDCHDIILGTKAPNECPLFKKVCHPKHPMGPCMVSHEGACLAHYKYGR